MKAAVMEAFGEPLKIHDDWADPQCGPGDVVLELKACGICRSDYTLWNGGAEWIGIVPPLPSVLGHEYCGVIEELGSEVKGFAKGERVVSPFGHACGTCEFCDAGHQNVCANLTLPGMHYTGGFASHAKVANANVNVVRLPDAISFPEAAGMGCRFVTSYHGIVDQAAVQPGEWVAVFACGGVGLSAVDIASALGARVIAVSRSPEKLALAKQLGAEHTVTAGPDAATEIVELTGGGAHMSVDALGASETTIPAIMSLRTRGRHLRLGVSNKKDEGRVAIPVDVVTFRELSIIGSFGMQAARYPEMLDMVESGKVDPGLLVGDTVGLEDTNDVLDSMKSYETVAMSVITGF
ncbi:MAG TPA: zinc-binding dehydrogenase [Gemmatimonadota bacterium]|nr:zinc-binding dehydrogenase [Gemmatimonadota bacterium]